MPETEDFKKVLRERYSQIKEWDSGALRYSGDILADAFAVAAEVADAFYITVVDILETENRRLRKELSDKEASNDGGVSELAGRTIAALGAVE